LAREVACLLGRKLKPLKVKLNKTKHSTKKTIELKVADAENCPRYAGRVVRNVKVGPSPEWMRRRLESVGVNSINNIVAITNYVMLEYGQPLHAFDIRELHNGIVKVERSKGESFTSLDGS